MAQLELIGPFCFSPSFWHSVISPQWLLQCFSLRTGITWKVCNCLNSIVCLLNIQVWLPHFSILSTLPWTAVPTGAMVGTSGQQGHEHKGLEGRACRAAAAMVQKQKYLSCFWTVVCTKQKLNSLKISGFIPLFFFKWNSLSERTGDMFPLKISLATYTTTGGLCFCGDEVTVERGRGVAVWLRTWLNWFVPYGCKWKIPINRAN